MLLLLLLFLLLRATATTNDMVLLLLLPAPDTATTSTTGATATATATAKSRRGSRGGYSAFTPLSASLSYLRQIQTVALQSLYILISIAKFQEIPLNSL